MTDPSAPASNHLEEDHQRERAVDHRQSQLTKLGRFAAVADPLVWLRRWKLENLRERQGLYAQVLVVQRGVREQCLWRALEHDRALVHDVDPVHDAECQ